MNEILIRVLNAQLAQGATDEAIKQISAGAISGDWIVWTFPCLETNLKDMLWSQGDTQLDFEERFQKLRQYALRDRNDAEIYLSNQITRRNTERICSALMNYDKEYVYRVFDQWLSTLWSGLSMFEYLCPECCLFHELREKLFPNNKDLVSITFLECGWRLANSYNKDTIIEEIRPASAKERKRLKRILKHFSIEDSRELRVTNTEFMPVYYDGNLYLWGELERAEDVASLSHSIRSEKKVVKDKHGRLWLSTLYDDSSYDCRVIRTYIKVESIQDAEELCELHGTFSSESMCRPPYFFRENLEFIKFVKPVPEHMTIREEIDFTINNTQIL